VEGAFITFMDRVPFYGAVTACIDNDLLRSILPRTSRRIYTYGEREEADFRLEILPRTAGSHARFQVTYQERVIGPLELHVPGKHNVLNATAAVAIGVQLGVTDDKLVEGIAAFRGVDRRFQIKGVARGVTIVDDYGHHPTEVQATLRAARECGYGRVLVLFQPHRYTRTRDLMAEFAGSFGDADVLQVLDIYAASEHPIPGVNTPALVEEVRLTGHPSVFHAESMEAAVQALVTEAREGDVILTLGAGNVSQAGALLLSKLEANA
jgi:UDP-N-acetylmuramate--alanine ligase